MRRLFIDLIVPKWDSNGKLISYENHVINVNYLRNDIDILLETFKDEILDELNNTVKADFVDVSAEDDEIF